MTRSARVDRTQATIKKYLEKYDLDGELWERPGGLVPNLPEIEAQAEKLLDLINNPGPPYARCPQWVIRQRTSELLGCFITQYSGTPTTKAVPSIVAILIGRLLGVQTDIRGGVKEPNALAAAVEYTKTHPAASQNAVAKAVNVHSSTVSAWFEEGKLPDWSGPHK